MCSKRLFFLTFWLVSHLKIVADPDPVFSLTDPAYLFDADPDPTFQFDADPDPQHCFDTDGIITDENLDV
jgi:hypothetical protein